MVGLVGGVLGTFFCFLKCCSMVKNDGMNSIVR